MNESLDKQIAYTLETYKSGVIKSINAKTGEAMKDLLQRTKEAAPVRKQNGGRFKKSITSRKETDAFGTEKHTWYVKAPEHRLTHLLANGHQSRNGGRVPAVFPLAEIVTTVEQNYIKNIEEVLKDGG